MSTALAATRTEADPVDARTAGRVRLGRLLVIVVGLGMLAAKLTVAASTFGTNDIAHWLDFTIAVRKVGPIDVYSYPFRSSLYNHPPLIGFFLVFVNWVGDHGIPFTFTIRAVSCVADFITGLIVFELIRKRRGLVEATIGGLVIAVSPVLFGVSGFHGNTDPVFVMFTLLSVYLLVDRQAPVGAGVCMALAVGVKIVPVVAVPCLLVYAFRRGWGPFIRFCLAMGVVLVITWGPAVLSEWPKLRMNVLGYTGSAISQWGLIQFGHWALNPWWVSWLQGTGRLVVVAVCALVPAVAVWRRPDVAVTGVALSLVMFFTLSPAFAMQYFAWAAAASVVVSTWRGALYNLIGGALVIHVYNRWCGGLPWTRAYATILTPREIVAGVLVWAILLSASWWAIRQIYRRPSEAEVATDSEETVLPTPADEDSAAADRAVRAGPASPA